MFNLQFSIHHFFRYLIRALVLLWKADKTMALANILMQILQAILPVISLYSIKLLVENVTGNHSAGLGHVWPPVALFLSSQFLLALAGQYAAYINTIHQQKLTDFLAKEVLEKATRVDYEYYENPAYHDTLHLAQQQSLFKVSALLTGFNAAILNGFSLIFLVGFFISIHSLFALFFIVFLFPLAVIKWYTGIAIQRQERKLAPLEREAAYLHQTLTAVNYAKEVRVFGYGDFFIHKFNRIRLFVQKEKQRLNYRLTHYSIAAETIEIIAMTVVFGFLARQAWAGTISVGALVIYIQGFQRLQSNSKNFLQSLIQILQQRVFLKDLFLFFDIETKKAECGNKRFSNSESGLTIRNLYFTYPQTNRQVLKDISVTCRPGKVIAIVGENGSGKSTLVKLLARLYTVKQGEIRIHGNRLDQIEENEYREKSIFLFQDYEKYFFTVAENIVLNKPVDETDKEAIEKALKLSGADQFVQKLANGYQTRMGRIFEGSEQLSGGQWQKLSLTRVFYKNADLLVLDEPTSSIDASAELEIFQNIKAMAAGKMVILITHRLYNLKIADYIYVMKDGSIAEEGDFDSLVQESVIFKKMYEAQKL